jgi:hypothetical protein
MADPRKATARRRRKKQATAPEELTAEELIELWAAGYSQEERPREACPRGACPHDICLGALRPAGDRWPAALLSAGAAGAGMLELLPRLIDGDEPE